MKYVFEYKVYGCVEREVMGESEKIVQKLFRLQWQKSELFSSLLHSK